MSEVLTTPIDVLSDMASAKSRLIDAKEAAKKKFEEQEELKARQQGMR